MREKYLLGQVRLNKYPHPSVTPSLQLWPLSLLPTPTATVGVQRVPYHLLPELLTTTLS